MDMSKKNDDFLACACRKKSKGEIMDMLREGDYPDIYAFRDQTGIGAKCGACMEDIQQLFEMVRDEK